MDPKLKFRTLQRIKYLQLFDLDIRCVSGKSNVVADVLSWFLVETNNISVLEANLNLSNQIIAKYDNASLFKNILPWLRNGKQLRGRYLFSKSIIIL